MAKKAKDPNKKSLWAEFKEFINKGNAFMLAVGVVIGAAFSAIVNAFVDILVSACTAAVPGGIAGFVLRIDTPKAQGALEAVRKTIADANFELTVDEYLSLCEAKGAPIVSGLYSKFGGRYIFNTCTVLNFGALINAIISFLIIAVVLFIMVKIVNSAQRKREALQAKLAKKEEGEAEAEEKPAE